MSEFNFKSQPCTSCEQSKRLLALGLKKETADMVLTEFNDGSWRPTMTWIEEPNDYDASLYPEFETIDIPAWSLHRLMCLVFNSGGTRVELFEDDDAYEILIYKIEMRIKEGYFNKEYLV